MRDTSDPADCGEQSVCGYSEPVPEYACFHRIQDLHDTETAACFSHAGSDRTHVWSQSEHAAGSVLWSYRYRCWTGTAGYTDRFSQQRCHVRRGISPRCWPEYQSRSWCRLFPSPESAGWLWSGQDTCARYRCFWSRARCCQNAAASIQSYRYDPAAIHQRTSHQIPFSDVWSLYGIWSHVQWNHWSDVYLHCLSSSLQRFQWTPRYRSAERWWCASCRLR